MNLLEKLITFSKANRLTTHLVFWIIVFLVAVGNSNYYHPEFLPEARLTDSGVPMLTQIIAAYFLAYMIIPKLLSAGNYWIVFLMFIAGTYLLCAVSRMLIIYVVEPVIGKPPKRSETMAEILTDWWKLVYVYFFLNFSVAFVFVAFKSLRDYIAVQRASLSLEKQKTETELRLLKSQLNPHFLFNTLNNIFSLAVIRSEDTAAAVGRLSEILDHMLYRCNERFVPVPGEIKLLENYIGLEQLRYGERLRVNLQTAIDRNIVIAPLILLSIVENSFKHSAADDSGNTSIIIRLECDQENIKFICSNSYDPDSGPGPGGHIGLQNLRNQLDLLYPSGYSLDIRRESHIFTVVLRIAINDKVPTHEN